MRFKKLIAAGGAFLLLVGASTIGAAAAYADDAVPPAETAVVEPAPEPVVEPAPAPAPEPVVEPAPEPVVEPAPEPASDPIVEPAEEPVPSDTPSGESDSDPPAGLSTDSTSGSSDSGDAPVTNSFFTKSTSSLKSGFAAAKPADTTPQTCLDLTAGLGYEAKVDTVGDPSTVAYTAPTGFLVAAYCVKAGSASSGGGPQIIDVVPDAASIVIDHPDVNSVSHYQVLLVRAISVTPAADGSDQTCYPDEETGAATLVGGSIQLTVLTGVTYTITGPNPGTDVVVPNGSGLATGLAPGDYNVAFVLGSGYTTSVVSPIVITIGAYEGGCGIGEDISVIPAADGSDETCDEEENTLVGGSIQLTLIDGVTYTITGPNPATDVIVPNGSGLATGLAPGDYNVAFVLDSGYTTSVVSPIVITIGEYDGECGEVIDDCVEPTFAGLNVFTLDSVNADPECDDDKKVSLCHATQGSDPWEGINISVQAAYNGHVAPPANADDHLTDIIPPFTYYVQGNPVNFPGLNFPYSGADDPEWLAFFGNDCADPEEVTPAAQGSDETCDEEEGLIVGGTIQLTVITGVTYTITGPGGNVSFNGAGLATGLTAGDYDVTWVLDSGYTTSVVSPIEITIGEYDGECGEEDDIVVNPAAQATDQDCVNLITVEGQVQVTVINGVTYTVTGPNGVVPLDGSGSTGPVPPGQYSVAFVLDAGYTTLVVSPIVVDVLAFDGECELVDFPLVIPAVTSSALSCLGLGSYTLSNDLGDAMAVEWTVNGSPLGIPLSSPSQFSVTSPGVYQIHADPNGPDYGFPDGSQDDWTLTFVNAENCDLATLALTGQSPNAFIGGAMVLILTGLALFRIRTTRRERPNTI